MPEWDSTPQQLGAALLNPNLANQFAKARANIVPPDSVMDARYPDWRKNQNQADQFLIGADLVSSAIPFAPTAAKLAKFLAPQAGVMAENYLLNSGLAPQLTVYHGSPYRFQPTPKNVLGEFDSSKIGTGEGAQAYGHGHYVAEAPSVAKSYQGSVSAMHKIKGLDTGSTPTIQGKPINWDDPAQVAAFELSRHNGDRAAAAEFHAKTFLGGDNNPAVKLLRSDAALPSVDLPGHFYTVDLPDSAIAKMLDWDKPLSQQGNIKAALDAVAKDISLPRMQDAEGAGFAYQHLANAVGGPNNASALLRSQGIPGIRYLDQGSRAGGAGTSNFVVFPGNENLLKILGRE